MVLKRQGVLIPFCTPKTNSKQKVEISNISLLFIHNPKLKNSYLSIDRAGEVILKSPTKNMIFLTHLVAQKTPWIHAKQKEILQNKKPSEILGENIYYFGELTQIASLISLDTKIKLLKLKSSETYGRCYDTFLKEEAKAYLSQRLNFFAQIMSLEYRELRLRKMKRRWGSCDTRKIITLNINLIKLDPKLIDYVVVHELAHLKHMNHSRAFHTLVNSYLSDEKERRKLLKHTSIM